jgi:hypothetical protein
MDNFIASINNFTNERKIFYEKEKIVRNYRECNELCKDESTYKLCLYQPSSEKYAISTIKIYIPECSSMVDYSDIIKFTDYIENGILKKLPYDCIGVIPNFKYVIGDEKDFMERNIKNLHKAYYDNTKNRYSEYYLIELKIPFIMM